MEQLQRVLGGGDVCCGFIYGLIDLKVKSVLHWNLRVMELGVRRLSVVQYGILVIIWNYQF